MEDNKIRPTANQVLSKILEVDHHSRKSLYFPRELEHLFEHPFYEHATETFDFIKIKFPDSITTYPASHGVIQVVITKRLEGEITNFLNAGGFVRFENYYDFLNSKEIKVNNQTINNYGTVIGDNNFNQYQDSNNQKDEQQSKDK